MKPFILDHIPELREKWEDIKMYFTDIRVPAKTTLLYEGDIADTIYFINQGCLRLWFNDDGRDITFQFFFEQQGVSSYESFYFSEPSLFNLEAIEEAHLTVLTKYNYQKMLAIFPELKDYSIQMMAKRFARYNRLFLSRIKNSPQERYIELSSQEPELIERVPHHYIASYLGITPVSLSRIRKKISSDINNC